MLDAPSSFRADGPALPSGSWFRSRVRPCEIVDVPTDPRVGLVDTMFEGLAVLSQADISQQASIVPELVGHEASGQHLDNSSSDALLMGLRQGTPSERPGGIGLQDASEREPAVLLDQLDTDLGTGEIARFDALDHCVHEGNDQTPAGRPVLLAREWARLEVM